MTQTPTEDGHPLSPQPFLRSRIREWGTTGWKFVGIVFAVTIAYLALVAFSGLVVPLLVASAIGALGVPVIDLLERKGLPRQVGALAFIAAVAAFFIAAVAFVVDGLIRQGHELHVVVTEGLQSIDDRLGSGVIGDAGTFVDRFAEQGRPMLGGAAAWATTIFSSAVAFGIGAFLALFMLYYILVDWASVRGWLARHLGVPEPLGAAIIDDAADVVRRGFGALTLTSFVTSVVIGLTMVALDLPLGMAVAVVTFVTSYVPYLGAVLSGAFGFLVALGSGNLRDALILLVVIFFAQTVIQTLVGNRITSNRLSLHPLPSIILSIFGVAVAGLLGAMLSAPALALGLAVSRRLKSPQHYLPTDVADLRGPTSTRSPMGGDDDKES